MDLEIMFTNCAAGPGWRTAIMLFQADEIDWDENTGNVKARGHVYFQNFDRNERLWCDHLEYNTDRRRPANSTT